MNYGKEALANHPAPKPNAKRTYVRWLLQELAQRWHKGLGILATSLLLNLCGLVAPKVTQAIFDRVLPQFDFKLLTTLLLVLLAVTALQIGLTVWRRLEIVGMSLGIDYTALLKLWDHLLALPTSFFRHHRAGDLAARFQDHQHVRYFFVGSLSRVMIDAVMVVVYVVVIFTYNLKLALIVVGFAGVFVAWTLSTGPRLRRLHRSSLEAKAAQEGQLVEILAGVDLVKAMALEPPLKENWGKLLKSHVDWNYRTQRLRQILESTGTAIQFAGTAALLSYGTILVLHGELLPGELIALSMYATLVLSPLLGLVGVWDEVQQANASLDRIGDILAHRPEQAAGSTTRATEQPLLGHIVLQDVHFRYGEEAAGFVLLGLHVEIHPGECVAIVGQSGAGKSTLALLLLGLYMPTKGCILVDGEDLRHLDVGWYRRHVGVVAQENVLLRGSILENITLGDPSPSLERAAQAARLAGADEFIRETPQGYDTLVGERGLNLSGGQRQRLSLARALYRNPAVLILDEPTSALDGVNARGLEDNLDAILPGRTTVLIAHRLSTLRKAHRILVLQQGRIVQEGTHEKLLASSSLYRGLIVE